MPRLFRQLIAPVIMATVTAVAARARARVGEPLECRPRSGIHIHTPAFHIIGQLRPTGDGDYWPIGATDGNAVFGHRGVWHVMHQTPNRTRFKMPPAAFLALGLQHFFDKLVASYNISCGGGGGGGGGGGSIQLESSHRAGPTNSGILRSVERRRSRRTAIGRG